MGFLFGQLTVGTKNAQIQDLEAQILNNEEIKQLQHNSFSNDETRIKRDFAIEQEQIENQMDALDDKTSDEYFDLMAEKKDLQNERDEKIEQIEERANEMQTRIDNENAALSERKEVLEQEKNATQEFVNQEARKEFGYFGGGAKQ